MLSNAAENGGSSEVFWGELTPCDHLVQIYETEQRFLETLQTFVATGLERGEAVVPIATPGHIAALEARLELDGLDLRAMKACDQFISLDALETLSLFMVDGWPDDDRFRQMVSGLLKRLRGKDRRVRAFGEMVALLWGQGRSAATMRLEHLWHMLCRSESFALYRAYPKAGFTQKLAAGINEICAAHSRVIPA